MSLRSQNFRTYSKKKDIAKFSLLDCFAWDVEWTEQWQEKKNLKRLTVHNYFKYQGINTMSACCANILKENVHLFPSQKSCLMHRAQTWTQRNYKKFCFATEKLNYLTVYISAISYILAHATSVLAMQLFALSLICKIRKDIVDANFYGDSRIIKRLFILPSTKALLVIWIVLILTITISLLSVELYRRLNRELR